MPSFKAALQRSNANLSTPAMVAAQVLFTAFYATLAILVIRWIDALEKVPCPCAENWRRTFLRGYFYFIMSWMGLQLLSVVALPFVPFMGTVRYAMALMAPLVMALQITFLVFSYQYLTQLLRGKCACGQGTGQTALQIYTYFITGILGFAILGGLVMGFMGAWLARMR